MATDSATDEDYWCSEDPPTSEDRDLDHCVASLCALLEQAGRGEALTWALSSALHSLECGTFKRTSAELSERQRWQILSALERAYRRAWADLPAQYPRRVVSAGMCCAVVLTNHWAARRQRQRDDPIYDARAVTRCFRNDLHNLSLAEEIAERANRRAQHDVELFSGALTSPPTINLNAVV